MKIFKRILKYFLLTIAALFVLLCIIPFGIPLNSTKQADDFKPFENSLFTKIEDVNIHYRFIKANQSKGNIVLVHGFSGSTFSWRKNTDFLSSQGYNVLLLDLPAFGYSDKKSGINHSPSNRAKLVWSLIEKLGYQNEKWNIVGHSMGGGVVMAMAVLKPSETEKIILVDGGVFSNSQNNSVSAWFRNILLAFPPMVRWIEVIADYNFYNEAYFKKLLGTAYSKEADEESVKGYLAPFLLEGTTNAIVESASNNKDVEPLDYESIKTPIYLIWGSEDSWVPLERGESISEKYNAPLKIMEGAGHNPMETEPEIFNRELLLFLKK